MIAAGWSEARKRTYVLADNKLALNAGWDDELLRVELTELQAFDFDLGLIGFSDDELASLTADQSVGLTEAATLEADGRSCEELSARRIQDLKNERANAHI